MSCVSSVAAVIIMIWGYATHTEVTSATELQHQQTYITVELKSENSHMGKTNKFKLCVRVKWESDCPVEVHLNTIFVCDVYKGNFLWYLEKIFLQNCVSWQLWASSHAYTHSDASMQSWFYCLLTMMMIWRDRILTDFCLCVCVYYPSILLCLCVKW